MRKRTLRKLPLYLLSIVLIVLGTTYLLISLNKEGFLGVVNTRLPAIAGISTKITNYIPGGTLSNIHNQGLAKVGIISFSAQSSASSGASLQEELKKTLEAKLEEFKKYIMDAAFEKMGYIPKDRKE